MVVLRSVVRALTALKRDLLNLPASVLGVDMGKKEVVAPRRGRHQQCLTGIGETSMGER